MSRSPSPLAVLSWSYRQEREAIVKEEVNFSQTGLLDADVTANGTVNEKVVASGIKLQYHEPVDSADPTELWRIYVFKDGKTIGTELRFFSRFLIIDFP
jgi:hypothetical protein